MIPRYQRILFWSLIAGIFLMSAFLLRGCQQAHKRLAALNDATPIAAPTATSTEDVTLYLANDADASITPTTESVALPQAPTLRARTLLEHLLAAYALPNSAHPLQSGPTVDDVFLLTPATNTPDKYHADSSQGAQLAIVNLRGSFVDDHPSGIQVEALTVQSIIGTLHAALPQVTGVRFLVDGQPHDTLAGHADLLRTYPATDTTSHPTPPTENPQL
ncbi:GerMN domain-containing protein [Tunturiibacter gelidiferens]|uniref:GerMN domain-containing protein n=1 Tax=Tunturiibacter gelidiferens TaxID=3069689 RepID=UPI003D9B22A2